MVSCGLLILAVLTQYMRFIELISERGMEDSFENKYAAVFFTSIHFFDNTTHNYISTLKPKKTAVTIDYSRTPLKPKTQPALSLFTHSIVVTELLSE